MRATLTIVLPLPVLLVVYSFAPRDPLHAAGVGGILLVGLAIFAAVLVYELRKVVRAETPVIAAVSAVALFIPLLLVIFAYVFFVLSHDNPASFTEPLTRVDAIYFAVTTFATVGFGDITAASQVARVLVTIQIILNVIVVGGIVRIFSEVAKRQAAADQRQVGEKVAEALQRRPRTR